MSVEKRRARDYTLSMKQRTLVPYLFLSILTLILFFIIGIRYGQHVEKTNKITSYLISIAPSGTTAPTQPPLAFKTYKQSSCGVQFLLPESYKVEKESTDGAMIQENNIIKISFECTKQLTLSQPTPGTTTLSFQKKTIAVSETNDKYIFTLRNPYNNFPVTFSVEKALYPLLEKSLEFVAK